MKKFTTLALAAALLTSGTAFANQTIKIEGQTNDLESGCYFLNAQDGAMTWVEADSKWYTTNDGQVRVKTRDVASIDVSTDKVLRDALGAVDNTKSVDYIDSSMWGENTRKTPVLDAGEDYANVTALDGGNVINLSLNHTILVSDSFVAEDNTNYFMNSVVTCTI